MDWYGEICRGNFLPEGVLRIFRAMLVFMILLAVSDMVLSAGMVPENTGSPDVYAKKAVCGTVLSLGEGVDLEIPDILMYKVRGADAAPPLSPDAVPETGRTAPHSPAQEISTADTGSAEAAADTAGREEVPAYPEMPGPDTAVLTGAGGSGDSAADIPLSEIIPEDAPACGVRPEGGCPSGTEDMTQEQPSGAAEVIDGFLVNGSGMICGIAEPGRIAADGYMELPSEGCSGIAAGTFAAGFPEIREIWIPSGITYIEEGAFAGLTGMEWYGMEPSGEYYTEEGVLFSENGCCLLAFPPGRTGTYKVPAQTERFAAGAFEGAQIEAVDATACSTLDTSGIPGHIRVISGERTDPKAG